ncbi:PIN/TRAM domain-containing protein [Eremococcus coleocola]|uniref:PIN/TRAM domain-containing protein n=2 Tax=Eremococcus coleocola TaxID=88132 RepID=UPI000480DBCE
MYKRFILLVALIIGISFGLTFGPDIWRQLGFTIDLMANPIINALIFSIIFLLIGFLLVPIIDKFVSRMIKWANQQTISVILIDVLGTIIGLVIGYLIALPFVGLRIPFISSTLPLILPLIFGFVGYQIAMTRREDLVQLFSRSLQGRKHESGLQEQELLQRKAGDAYHPYKLLDTSVIIDGRIADIVKTGFMEGTLVIPNFVLHELQLIADSSDSLKRAKGRRGLDILNQLQKDDSVKIDFYEGDFEDIDEVDSKLVRLAKLMEAAVVTNDYNLNKVCEFQNITVFNINALANAVKPVLIPGEQMTVMIIKAGTERKQGVAYLEDGTMIVVEDGQYYMNEQLPVIVTSALQTAAGRMIFAQPVHSKDRIEASH